MTSSKGDKIKWLCTHGPGGKCVNCTKVTKKWKEKPRKCTHPPHMRCPNCPTEDEEDGDEDAEPAAAAAAPAAASGAAAKKNPFFTSRCKHGPYGMCTLCLPPKTDEDDEPASAAPAKCRNHGPHGSCIDCISAKEGRKHKITSQKSPHVPATSIDRKAAQTFNEFLVGTQFTHQRCGVLYGRVIEGSGTRADVIYEPPQVGSEDGFMLLDDPALAQVDKLAELLGLERVGVILSRPRKNKPVPLTGSELRSALTVQGSLPARLRKGFVVVTTMPDSKNNLAFEAYQLSDQVSKMFREGIVATEQTNQASLITTSPVLVEASETTTPDAHFFVCPIAIMDHVGQFRMGFPIENRPLPQDHSALGQSLRSTKNLPFPQRVCDFHLLLYLASKHLDMETDIPPLCKAIVDRDDKACDGFKLIIESIAGI